MTIEYGPVPRYRQLANILRAQIESGELPPGRPIPSKRTLRERYGIASETVDRAVRVLKDEGRLETVPGLGLFVTERGRWR
jgi:GntR family transcriptional regulator